MAIWNLYRKQNSNGSTKDWAIKTNSDGSISTRWGKTASHLPSLSTRNGIRQVDIEKQKRAKGYVFLAEVEIDDDDGKVTFSKPEHPALNQPEVPMPISALYWHIDCRAEPEVCVEFGIEIRRLMGDIQSLQAQSQEYDQTKDQVWEGWQPLLALTLSPEPFTQSGQIKQAHGILPWLFMLALKHKSFAGIEIDIVTENSREISTDLKVEQEVLDFFGADVEAIRTPAEILGLLKPRINLALAMTDAKDYWF
jgi:hypothetical protein